MSLFQQLDTDILARQLLRASWRVAFIGPALNQALAAALVQASRQLGREQVRVILDYNEEIFRLGYGEHEAIELLREEGITIHKQPGLRISALLVDKEGWVLHQSPMAVEDPSLPAYNAIKLLPEQVAQLALAVGVTDQLPGSTPDTRRVDVEAIEIGKEPLAADEVVEVKHNLDQSPPQAFDLQRQVRVYSAHIQFVEIELSGGRIGTRTIQLPAKLRTSMFGDDKEVEKRLKASYRLLDATEIEGLDEINQEVETLRDYTRTLNKRLGRILLVNHRQNFLQKRDAINQQIEQWKQHAAAQIQAELDKSIRALAHAGADTLLAKMPPEFTSGLLTSRPSLQDAEEYLVEQFQRVAPSAQKLVEELKLDCTFKDVTYEMLKDDAEFAHLVQKAYPGLQQKMFEESQAAYSRAPGMTADLFSNLSADR